MNERSPSEPASDLEALVEQPGPKGLLDGRIDAEHWAGLPQKRAKPPSVRFGRRWFNTLWLLPLVVVALLVSIAVAQQLRQYSWMQDFINDYPGTSPSYAHPVDSGFPWWLRWQHFFNLLFMIFIIRAGIQILADHPRLYFNHSSQPGKEWLRLRDPVPADRMDPAQPERMWTAKDDSVALPKHLGLPGFRHSIGLARWWHFGFDLLFIVNGAIFYVLLFATGQWQRLVPQDWDVFGNALSAGIQYLSLDLPANEGFTMYNGLQQLAYFGTVFIAAPLALITGLLQAPSISGRLGLASGVLNRQVARTVHFWVLTWMISFIFIHTVMVYITGFVGNLNHITLGTDTDSYWSLAIYALWMAIVVVLWLAATPFTIARPRVVQRVGRAMIGWVKAGMEWGDPKRTYSEKQISPFFWPNGKLPDSEVYRRLSANDWADYSLRIEGLVAHPVELSLADLRALPKREQITQHFCIQGWSGIAKWGGVAMSDVLDMVEPSPSAQWVVFYSFAEGPEEGAHVHYYDCHRIAHMRHELTILAYEMNGEVLNEAHGAPLRLRNELELGFKQVKWIEGIEFVESFEHIGAGQGGFNEDVEFFGYRMPI